MINNLVKFNNLENKKKLILPFEKSISHNLKDY